MDDEVAAVSRDDDVPDRVIRRHVLRPRVVQVAQQPSYALHGRLQVGSLERHRHFTLDVLHDMPPLLIEAE